MKKLQSCFVLLMVVATLVGCSTEPSKPPASQTEQAQTNNTVAPPFNTDAYAEVLKAYVNEAGFVDYRGLQVNAAPLKAFNRSLGEVSPQTFASWNEAEQIAFLINAYNAFTLESIIDQSPLKASIRDIPGVWRIRKFQVAGQAKTLDEIEHQTLRKNYQEPRIHAALNCTAISCPSLRTEPYTGEKLDQQLDEQVRRWLNSPEGVQIDRNANQVQVSALFDWFGQDWTAQYAVEQGFTGNAKQRAFLNFISQYLSPDDRAYLMQGNYRLSYLDYNWTLNEQK
jgi:Protein of unknown function, DUF547